MGSLGAAGLAVVLAGPGRGLAPIARAVVCGRPRVAGDLAGPRAARPTGSRARSYRPHIAWTHPAGWVLGLLFGLQSVVFYGVAAWLAAVYVDRGWTDADAAQLVAVFIAVGLVATVTLPLHRRPGRDAPWASWSHRPPRP